MRGIDIRRCILTIILCGTCLVYYRLFLAFSKKPLENAEERTENFQEEETQRDETEAYYYEEMTTVENNDAQEVTERSIESIIEEFRRRRNATTTRSAPAVASTDVAYLLQAYYDTNSGNLTVLVAMSCLRANDTGDFQAPELFLA